MKKCPVCGAELEENARFCLYCMTPLEEKQKITFPKSKRARWLVILAAVLVLALAVGGIVWLTAGRNSSAGGAGQEPADKSAVGAGAGSSTAAGSGGAAGGNPSKLPATPGSPSAGGPETASAGAGTGSTQGHTAKASAGASNGTVPANGDGGSGGITNGGVPAGSNSGGKTASAGGSAPAGGQGAASSTAKPPEEPAVSTAPATQEQPDAAGDIYIYRAAKSGDDFYVYSDVEGTVVITGVKEALESGEYVIPETIGGKRVIAIMGNAFNDEQIRDTVKKIVVPASVKTIWDHAFSMCYNLTDIYFCGDAIYTSPYAFALASRRTGTLTIHCSENCTDRNFRYYKNSAPGSYDAVYKEWNG